MKRYLLIFYFYIKMEKFNQLPNEIQTHVLKEYPNFRRINKQQYKEKYLFDTLYCDLDISKKEFLTYLKNHSSHQALVHPSWEVPFLKGQSHPIVVPLFYLELHKWLKHLLIV